MEDLLTIGQLAKRSGVAPSALRYYEDRGLISSIRTHAGHRRYERPVLRRIAFIVFAQKIGLTLEQVSRELGRLPHNRVPTKAHWAMLGKTWTNAIDERIAQLEILRDSLTSCIGCGCLSLRRCKLANPGDEAARSGPGPREWLRGVVASAANGTADD
jgi:MerR family redox-sensitive transcriptional activator SoxR